jgi:hypothetical protein
MVEYATVVAQNPAFPAITRSEHTAWYGRMCNDIPNGMENLVDKRGREPESRAPDSCESGATLITESSRQELLTPFAGPKLDQAALEYRDRSYVVPRLTSTPDVLIFGLACGKSPVAVRFSVRAALRILPGLPGTRLAGTRWHRTPRHHRSDLAETESRHPFAHVSGIASGDFTLSSFLTKGCQRPEITPAKIAWIGHRRASLSGSNAFTPTCRAVLPNGGRYERSNACADTSGPRNTGSLGIIAGLIVGGDDDRMDA